MKKTVAILLSILMLVSCLSMIPLATSADPAITDGTANASGAVVRNQGLTVHAVPATGISDGTEWHRSDSDYRLPENMWVYDTSLEQLQLGNVSNDVYPTITVGEESIEVYGSRALLADPTCLTKFEVTFESASKGAKTWINGASLYASIDGITWDVLYTFSGITAATAGVQTYAVDSNSKFYNYVALYTSTANAGLCRLEMVIPYGYTASDALVVDVVRSYGQDESQRDFSTQEFIWEDATSVQYQPENFATPQSLTLAAGGTAEGYGAAAKLQVPSKINYFEINRQANAGKLTTYNSSWSSMTLYGSTDGGNTWMAIAHPTNVTTVNTTTHHAFLVDDAYTDTVFTDVALLTTYRFHLSQVIAYGTPATPFGSALSGMTTVDDGTKWISVNDDAGNFRDPTVVWEGNSLFQLQSANTFSLGDMGLGAAAKLEYPTKLTGFMLTLDMTNGKGIWKTRANSLSVYASVDGEEWVQLHTVSGCANNTVDSAYVITVDDDTLYNYVGIYSNNPTNGFRLRKVTAYGDSNGEAITLRGYQTRYYTNASSVKCCAVRFVATVDEAALDNQKLGFSVTANYIKAGVAGSQVFDLTTNFVYTSLVANGTTLTVDDIAPDSGHEYLVLGTIKDIVRSNYDYVTFTVTPYVKNASGDTIESAPATIAPATGYPYSDWTINGKALNNFKIVYATDGIQLSTVTAFRNQLAQLSGYTLPIGPASDSAATYEILIGETGRAATTGVTRPRALNYTIKVSGNKLVIRTGGEHSLELLMANFFDIVTCGANEALTMGGSYSLSGNFYDDPYENTDLADGADIRVMSANVLLRDTYSNTGTYYYDCTIPELNTYEDGTFEFERRVEIFMAALDYYGPAVVGVQEFNNLWVDAVQDYIDNSSYYSNWKIKVFDTWNAARLSLWKNATSGILYRSDLLTLGTSGMTPYTNRNNDRGQCYTWANFTVKSTSDTFTFVSTHWGAGDMDGGGTYEESQSAEFTTFVSGLSASSIITTGDFNQSATNEPFTDFLTGSSSVDAKTSAAKLVNNTGSWHTWAGTTNSSGSCDHITAKGCTVKSYETLFYNQQIFGSDHAWIIADLTIGG